ncbi:MAG: DUF4398 domain-containing protein [candidate division Zixibacteria bacterium]|nr:DUF4398 domain-containing protein [candidate division Zixibacteria bacterium]
MFKRIAVVFVVFVLLAFVSCAKAPEQEIQNANSAIEAARTAESEEYAPDAFQVAMDTLNAANAAKTEADGKFALLRSYGKAKELFVRAEGLANEAATTAQTEKERVKAEVTELITQAQTVLDSANAALKKAPRGKGSKADIELIKNELAAAQAGFDEGQADFNTGKYKTAKAKIEAAMQKAQAVTEEIAQAAAKKTGK